MRVLFFLILLAVIGCGEGESVITASEVLQISCNGDTIEVAFDGVPSSVKITCFEAYAIHGAITIPQFFEFPVDYQFADDTTIAFKKCTPALISDNVISHYRIQWHSGFHEFFDPCPANNKE